MGTVRVLVANEPRSYREAIAVVLRAVCGPFIEVSEAEELDATALGARPHLVICSLATPAVREAVGVWVELYPGHGSLSNVGFHGEVSALEGMELPDIRSVVERTRAALAGTST
ncbi:MAG TPA: hypothetical protein VKA73_09990 [Rubrobacter sp.]|nr:hypothetical protein [Rubrobacter sp.]